MTDRVDQLEVERATEKKHFEKLVKYVESSLNALKNDLEDYKISQKSIGSVEVSQLMEEIRGLQTADSYIRQGWARGCQG